MNVLLLVNVSSWTSSVSALTTPPLRPRVRMCVHFRFVTVKKGEVAVTFDAGNLKLLGAVCMPPTHRRKKPQPPDFSDPPEILARCSSRAIDTVGGHCFHSRTVCTR